MITVNGEPQRATPDYADSLDPLLMHPARLFTASMLADLQWHRFATIVDTIRADRAVVSNHLKILRRAGYMEFDRHGTHTSWRLTPHGHDRLADHLDALRDVIIRAGQLVRGARV